MLSNFIKSGFVCVVTVLFHKGIKLKYIDKVRKEFVAELLPILKVANKEWLICRNPIKLDLVVPH